MQTTVTPTAEGDSAVSRALADHLPVWILLVSGFIFTALTGNRWGVEAFAWVAPVPFLLYLRRGPNWRGQLLLLGMILLATGLQVAKIITPPISYAMVPAFSLPAAVSMFVGLNGVELIRRRAGEVWAVFALASLTAVGDWLTYSTSYMGAWGTTGNTQLSALPLLQLASLFGLAGIGFLMAWTQGALALYFGVARPGHYRRLFVSVGVALSATLIYGSYRVFATHDQTVTVAAVVTDLGMGNSLPSPAELTRNTETLFARTELAASRGARLVVWNEAAALVEPDQEAALIARAKGVAQARDIDLVLAYGVIASRAPLMFDNKFVFLSNEGTILQTYRKHHPVPGEPSMTGDEPLLAIERPYGKVSGAICYDFDFPALTREHAKQGTDLFVVPSSDWLGIDPYHTEMARVRAIEGGFSVLRSTRWGASAGFDAYGRVRGWMPVTESNERVLLASLPMERVPTLYTIIGDLMVVFAAAYLALALFLTLRRKAPDARPLSGS